MKQQTTKYIILLLLIAILVVPSVALASWWNPLSWGWNWNVFDLFMRPHPNVVQIKQNPNQTADWQIYTSPDGSYSISYPSDATIHTSDPTCVYIQRGIGELFINNGDTYSPCGGTTGLGTTDVKTTENININNQEYPTAGYVEGGNSGFLGFNFTNSIYVNYEANMDNYSPTVTSQQYSDAITSIKEVLSTLKSLNSANITITSPNGGEQWIQGKTYNITWTVTGLPASDTVNIVLLSYDKNGANVSGKMLNGNINTSLDAFTPANAGSYAWQIPSTITAETNYKIEVNDNDTFSSNQVAIHGLSSNYFSIVTSTTNQQEACVNSGGTVTTATCYCSGTKDFYNTCLVGACTCPPNPAAAHTVTTCSCPSGKCWDGNSCANVTQ